MIKLSILINKIKEKHTNNLSDEYLTELLQDYNYLTSYHFGKYVLDYVCLPFLERLLQIEDFEISEEDILNRKFNIPKTERKSYIPTDSTFYA